MIRAGLRSPGSSGCLRRRWTEPRRAALRNSQSVPEFVDEHVDLGRVRRVDGHVADVLWARDPDLPDGVPRQAGVGDVKQPAARPGGTGSTATAMTAARNSSWDEALTTTAGPATLRRNSAAPPAHGPRGDGVVGRDVVPHDTRRLSARPYTDRRRLRHRRGIDSVLILEIKDIINNYI